MTGNTVPLIVVSMGDPGGIGPEVVVKALSDAGLRARARWVVCGIERAARSAADRAGVALDWRAVPEARPPHDADAPMRGGEVVLLDWPVEGRAEFAPGPDARSGALSFAFVERAIALAKLKPASAWRASGIVTAPIAKAAWTLAGHGEFPGHTELVAARLGVTRYAMMFHAPPAPGTAGAASSDAGINVILATAHLPLREVPRVLTTARVLEVITLGRDAMRALGVPSPRVGVCGLNPHAGEGGLLGDEDDRIIAPGVARAREAGIDATGPHPADTIFQGAPWRGGEPPSRFDLVVAMYHDQGLIPVKTLAWDRAVNMTVGLPVLRTSPDHGTAFDIAGRNLADAGSMKAAMLAAVRAAGVAGR